MRALPGGAVLVANDSEMPTHREHSVRVNISIDGVMAELRQFHVSVGHLKGADKGHTLSGASLFYGIFAIMVVP